MPVFIFWQVSLIYRFSPMCIIKFSEKMHSLVISKATFRLTYIPIHIRIIFLSACCLIFREQEHVFKVKARPHEASINTAFTCKDVQRVVCLCVKNTRMKSLSVPCITEQLAKLDQWQCHSVHTHHPVHTRISFALSFHTDMDTVTLHSPSHENTQHRVRDGSGSFSHTPVDPSHSAA